MPTEAVYVLWPREEDYPSFAAACTDRPVRTYAEFIARAEPMVAELRAKGIEVRIVHPDVDHMAAWCRERSGRVDNQTRTLYAAIVGLEEPTSEDSIN